MRKVACITGGSHGIGRGMAIALGKAGYAVAFTYYENEGEAIEVQQTLSTLGMRCACYQAKMEDITAAEQLISRVRREFGQIDVMICNGAMDRRMSILTVTPEQMQFMTTQLYISQILCASRAAQWMVKDEIAGSILFTSSVRAQRADTSDFLYGGMKAALERSCQSLALELAPYGIRSTALLPAPSTRPAIRRRGLATGCQTAGLISPLPYIADWRRYARAKAGGLLRSLRRKDGMARAQRSFSHRLHGEFTP